MLPAELPPSRGERRLNQAKSALVQSLKSLSAPLRYSSQNTMSQRVTTISFLVQSFQMNLCKNVLFTFLGKNK